VLAEYEHQQYGRRKNLAARNGQGKLVFLYRMCDLPITKYRTRNYPNPYIEAEYVTTRTEDEILSPLRETAWQGGSQHAEWEELRRQILQRDGYTCQHCSSTNKLEVHHIKPHHKGGADSPENLITLCEDCHIQFDDCRAQFAQ
jgi:hypothetical protein